MRLGVLVQDFGYQGTNTISGTLWVDTDSDGYMDASETGRLAGVTLALCDANGNIIATAATDTHGNYSFTYLPNGVSTVRITDQQNVLNGYIHTLGAVNTDSHSQTTPLTAALSGNTFISYADFGFYAPPYQPTAVTLVSFTATADGQAIRLDWETATELDNLGFNLYRAESPTGPRVRLNANLIPAQEPGRIFGASYDYLDETVTPGVTYYYWLEAIDIHGAVTLHGPEAATLAGQTLTTRRFFLPLVSR